MTKRQHTKLVHEGEYVAEVDDVREALREGALQIAMNRARVFKLTPVSV